MARAGQWNVGDGGRSEGVGEALRYLALTDEQFGALRGAVKASEYTLKVIKAQAFLDTSGTVAEREAQALTSAEFVKAFHDYKDLHTEFATMEAKRKTKELEIEVWRSTSANRRAGNV